MKKIIGVSLILIAIVIMYNVAFTGFLETYHYSYIAYIFAPFFLLLGYKLLRKKSDASF